MMEGKGDGRMTGTPSSGVIWDQIRIEFDQFDQ